MKHYRVCIDGTETGEMDGVYFIGFAKDNNEAIAKADENFKLKNNRERDWDDVFFASVNDGEDIFNA